ncbi:MAG: hypothetical protein II765_01635, partial [Lachnospiraceae bacterium]|nr:hypothetical protein [Lachnospiraceae bacterium]
RGQISWYIDIPSIILILVILIPGLIIMGAWKDFIKAFSVGTKHYSLLELKNILGAVSTAQKLVVLGALFALIISAIVVLGQVSDASLIGPNLAICFLTAFYAVIIEMLLLPLHLNVEREMNREMDFEDE